jgi:hypothetical protein
MGARLARRVAPVVLHGVTLTPIMNWVNRRRQRGRKGTNARKEKEEGEAINLRKNTRHEDVCQTTRADGSALRRRHSSWRGVAI